MGTDINVVINVALLPIGKIYFCCKWLLICSTHNTIFFNKSQLFEEAAETNIKVFKKFREHHTCKNSRSDTNEDLIHICCW